MKNLFFSRYIPTRVLMYQDPLAGAVTTESSTEYTNETASPPVKVASSTKGGKQRIAYFSFTQSAAVGDANSTANLVKLPPGKVRLLKPESRFVCSAFGAARLLDIGYLAHTKGDGTAVAASQDTILDGGDVAAAAKLECGAGTNGLGTDATILFDSRDGVSIQALCSGGTIPAGATLKGFFTYVIE